MVKFKIFQKLIILLTILLIPTALLFSYTNRTSSRVVQETLESSASKQLEYTMNDLEQSLRQIETQSLLLLNDSNIKAYSTSELFSEYVDHLLLRRTVEDRLTVYDEANLMIDNLTLHFPMLGETISSKKQAALSAEELKQLPKNSWFMYDADGGALSFRLLFTSPTYPSEDFDNVQIVLEAAVSADYLESVLQAMDTSGNGTSFLYFGEDQEDNQLISSHETDSILIPLMKSEEMLGGQPGPSRMTLEADGVRYTVQSIYSPSLKGTLVSYVRLDDFLSPLQQMKWLVRISLLLLFLSGLSFIFMLYRHFRLPFGYLVRKLERLGEGDVNSRAVIRVNNEFDYLFDRFNEMASRIKDLIENVYEERVRAREAEYKHLQSQINPHFLYNCLFYIVTMANKSPDAVIAMAKNLAHFYRYITRKAGAEVQLSDEIQLVEAYLAVQALRHKQLIYDIHIPADLHNLTVPTLMLQPLVENAIVHGLERKRLSGKISVRGEKTGRQYMITVDDDGAGMEEAALEELRRMVYSPAADHAAGEMSCALRNIHQRLVHRFGSGSGLAFAVNDWGGLRVVLTLANRNEGDDE